ncbi:Protein of unknown function [Tranquillimonas rosea]|uniref:DUF2948 family protein n=1 Tax=Tranquillimonas rosea TaxID=641238 RepID=A0A1H9RSP0_9RHOB|nr:DUF2948 family protein [Tranquillimonas rosea]SER75465.1 Protein of unknown function [Tranquillimonas rosea]
MSDARFEDGGEAPLRLAAFDDEDIAVISALVQDAVFPITEVAWQKTDRRFAILLNRFRWEDAGAAESRGRDFERVQSVLTIENVRNVQSDGIDQQDRDQVMSLLSISWIDGDSPSGRVLLTLAGDGAIAVDVEAAELMLRDVTRPYRAPSGQAPRHDD